MDRLLSMEVFVEVVKTGSFVRASEKFHISSAMVGKHIRSLEHHVGTTLLNRTTRKQSLTEVGRTYFTECERLLHEHQFLDQRISAIKNTASGVLRINAPITFGAEILSPMIGKFLDQHPHVSIDLSLTNEKVDVMHDDYDVILRTGRLENAAYIARQLCNIEMVFCASPTYLGKHGTPESIEALQHHQCLAFKHWRKHSPFYSPDELKPFAFPQARFQSNCGSALLNAALADLGIILQPKMLVKDPLADGSLVEILSAFVPPPRPISLLYRSRADQTLKTQLLINYLIDQFRPSGGYPCIV